MKKTNIVKKTVKPAYIVDITECENEFDTLVAFAEAKQKAGVAISDSELEALIDKNSVVVIIEKENQPICICEKPEKKPNIFKRFWNWIRRK